MISLSSLSSLCMIHESCCLLTTKWHLSVVYATHIINSCTWFDGKIENNCWMNTHVLIICLCLGSLIRMYFLYKIRLRCALLYELVVHELTGLILLQIHIMTLSPSQHMIWYLLLIIYNWRGFTFPPLFVEITMESFPQLLILFLHSGHALLVWKTAGVLVIQLWHSMWMTCICVMRLSIVAVFTLTSSESIFLNILRPFSLTCFPLS